MFVVDAIGGHIVEAYSSIGLVTSLYVESNISLYLPHLVQEKSLSIGKVLNAYERYL